VFTQLTDYVEYKYLSTSNNIDDYVCRELDVIGSSGTNHKYTVAHVYDPYANQGTWDAFLDGVLQVQADVGFGSATYAHVGGEFNADTYGPFTPKGQSSACYGCAGGQPLERATRAFGDPGGEGWTTVMNMFTRNTDGHWSIGSAPTPFTISHPYPEP
jgi:hypothetical protein